MKQESPAFRHGECQVVVVDTVEVKASLFDWLLRRTTEWRYEDEQIKEYWEESIKIVTDCKIGKDPDECEKGEEEEE